MSWPMVTWWSLGSTSNHSLFHAEARFPVQEAGFGIAKRLLVAEVDVLKGRGRQIAEVSSTLATFF
ncbi:hypothetical protein CPPEL_07355 [Corynebacterium pseudopelargi]|uniref:Uncharacterized protein n=1 Tax=Corynebacterium pseudopelargi TaxID=2080757 RepID=A0A3G6IUY1_9CORY|nr:hypothetical protein CPPEL_07355 [Corynebacterium pseudopelargi]